MYANSFGRLAKKGKENRKHGIDTCVRVCPPHFLLARERLNENVAEDHAVRKNAGGGAKKKLCPFPGGIRQDINRILKSIEKNLQPFLSISKEWHLCKSQTEMSRNINVIPGE